MRSSAPCPLPCTMIVQSRHLTRAQKGGECPLELGRSAGPIRCHLSSHKSSRVESSRVESSRAKPSRAESSRVEPSRVESSRVESSRVGSSRVESSQVKSHARQPHASSPGCRGAALSFVGEGTKTSEIAARSHQRAVRPLALEGWGGRGCGAGRAVCCAVNGMNELRAIAQLDERRKVAVCVRIALTVA